jgi:hypothetical protein
MHAMYCIVGKEGIGDLYHNLGPNYIMLMPTAGISLMCSKAYKRILVEGEEDEEEIDGVDDEEKELHDQEKWACLCLRLMTVKTIHDTTHILESQVCVGGCACVDAHLRAHTHTTYAPSQHIIIHYQTNDTVGCRG